MLVQEFRSFVSGIGGLTALDLGASLLTFSASPLAVHYEGLHCSGVSRAQDGVTVRGLPDLVAVDATVLLGTLGLFENEDELDARWDPASRSLILSAGDRKAALRAAGSAEPFRWKSFRSGSAAVLETREAAEVLRFLLDVSTTDVGAPCAMMGAYLQHQSGEIMLSATDSRRAGVAAITVSREFSELPELVIPAVDLSAALAAMGDYVAIKWTSESNSVELQDKFTSVFINLLPGPFPNLDSLPRDYSAAFTMKLSRSGVMAIAKAASVLDSGRVVKLASDDSGAARLVVEDAERGYFELGIGVGVGKPTEVRLDSDYLRTVGALSGDVVIRVISSNVPVQLEDSKGRKYWLSPLVLR